MRTIFRKRAAPATDGGASSGDTELFGSTVDHCGIRTGADTGQTGADQCPYGAWPVPRIPDCLELSPEGCAT